MMYSFRPSFMGFTFIRNKLCVCRGNFWDNCFSSLNVGSTLFKWH